MHRPGTRFWQSFLSTTCTSGFIKEHFAKTYPADSELADYFELARKICNGTKHFFPKAETRVQAGFSSGFSEGFARPLNLALQDDTEISTDQLLRTLADFWNRQQQPEAN